ncbi:MAG TPA: hypothetical protein VMJ10_08910 [Kofleriaceae bacterium]|nr:hypothetical protein [Kofleriaceae bacterium]
MRRALVLALAACGHAAPVQPPAPPPVHAPPPDAALPPPPPDAPLALEDDLPRLASRALHMYQDWQKALVDAGTDCAAAARNVNAVADTYADVIAANTRVLHAGHDRIVALKHALEPYDQQMSTAAEAIVHAKAIASCQGDPELGKALDRMGSSP